jgi:hypothetical protein
LALTTVSTSSLYFSLEVRVKGVPQNPEFADLFEIEITDVISNTKVFDGYFLSHRSNFPFSVNNPGRNSEFFANRKGPKAATSDPGQYRFAMLRHLI